MRTAILFFLVLTACGQGEIFTQTTCQHPCLMKIQSEFPLDCGVVQYDVDLALKISVDRQLWGSQEEACAAYQGVTVMVYSADGLMLDGQPTAEGLYARGVALGTGVVELTWRGRGLAHEFLHHRDWILKTASLHSDGTLSHDGWDSNGYYTAAEAYVAGYQHLGSTW